MRVLIVLAAVLAASGAQALTGTWHCSAAPDGTVIERGLQFIGGKLIHRDGLGRASVVENPAITDGYVFWNSGDQEFEFYPERGELIEHSRLLGGSTTLSYRCERRP